MDLILSGADSSITEQKKQFKICEYCGNFNRVASDQMRVIGQNNGKIVMESNFSRSPLSLVNQIQV